MDVESLNCLNMPFRVRWGRSPIKGKSLSAASAQRARKDRADSPPLSFRLFWKFTNTESTSVFSSTYSSAAVKLGIRRKMVNGMFRKLKIEKGANLQQKILYCSAFPDPRKWKFQTSFDGFFSEAKGLYTMAWYSCCGRGLGKRGHKQLEITSFQVFMDSTLWFWIHLATSYGLLSLESRSWLSSPAGSVFWMYPAPE